MPAVSSSARLARFNIVAVTTATVLNDGSSVRAG